MGAVKAALAPIRVSNGHAMSRALTIAWAERNCPDRRVVRDVAGQLDEAQRAVGHLTLLIGEALTRTGAPRAVARGVARPRYVRLRIDRAPGPQPSREATRRRRDRSP